MRKSTACLIASGILVVMAAGSGPLTAGPVEYKNCDRLRRQFYEYGVTNSKAHADRQVRLGYYRPKVNNAVYWENARLDRDTDRTACEVAV